MIPGVVTGEITSTIKHPFYHGHRLLVVDRTDFRHQPTGEFLIAIDAADAGVGDRVLVLDEGNGARQVVDDPHAPLRSVIVAVIDSMDPVDGQS